MKTEQESLIKQLHFGGFYKHYKHDPNGESGNYFYQVLGITSVKDLRKDFVTYRPLYKSFVYEQGNWYDGKEVSGWFKPLENGNTRYTFIEPYTEEYSLCKKLVQELYGDLFFAQNR